MGSRPHFLCVLVRPPTDSDQVRDLSNYCATRAETIGCGVRVIRTKSLLVVGGSGRSMNVLDPIDASNLYRDLHRSPTLVVALASALISLDPSRKPPSQRYTRPLEEFVAYKATYGMVRGEGDADAVFGEFVRWRKEQRCRDASDPRALPLHVFQLGSNGGDLDLSDEGGTRRFRRAFGEAQRRKDDAGRVWQAGVPHGLDVLQVAGRDLPAGTHWDVSSKRKSWRITNAREVWKIEGRAYVNAYPDEHLRQPRARYQGQARKIWSAGTKNAPS